MSWQKTKVTWRMLASIPIGVFWLYLIDGNPSPFAVIAFVVITYWVLKGLEAGFRLISGSLREIQRGKPHKPS